jgi:GntR family transcriptional regulator
MKTIAHTSTAAFQPLYRQIKTLITESLVSGEWRPGDLIRARSNWPGASA